MRRLPLVPALLLAACGAAPAEETERLASETRPIINGHACVYGEEPATLAILVDARLNFGSMGGIQQMHTVVCTGTLIAPDAVLLAAHCVDPAVLGMGYATVTELKFAVTGQNDLVALAEDDTNSVDFPADALPARAWTKHPLFSLDNNVVGPNRFNDIALLFLDGTTDIQPEIVVTAEEARQLVVGAEVDIAGWGQQTATSGWHGPPPNTVGRKVCARSFVNEMNRWEMQIGAGTETSRKCHGDSGGPSLLTVDTPWTNPRRVVGVTSHAYDQTDCAKGGVDTRVDAYLAWIDGELRKGCAEGRRAWCTVEGIIPPEFWEPVSPPIDDGGGGDVRDEGCAALAPSLPALLGLRALARRRRGAGALSASR